MTTIINKYVGITHPIKEALTENKEFCEAWKIANCALGIHVFDEVWALEHHYLSCDVCGMEVHISKIILPDGKDEVVGKEPEHDGTTCSILESMGVGVDEDKSQQSKD